MIDETDFIAILTLNRLCFIAPPSMKTSTRSAPPPFTEATSIACWQQRQFCSVTVPTGFPHDPREVAIETCFIDQGQGNEILVFLHGFDSSLLEFRRLLPLLSANYRAIAIDLLGLGFSERSPHLPPNPETIKRHLDCFWQQRIQQPIVLVGVSMGGAAALDFCVSFPERVQKLVLIDSAGLSKQPAVRWLMFPPIDSWLTQFLANPTVRQNISQTAYYDPTFASEDALMCSTSHLACDRWSEGLIDFTKSGGYGDFRSHLSQLMLPSLVVWGKQDKILGTKPAPQFTQLLPQSDLVWIEPCGHVPHLEQPAKTAAAIRQFLSSSASC